MYENKTVPWSCFRAAFGCWCGIGPMRGLPAVEKGVGFQEAFGLSMR